MLLWLLFKENYHCHLLSRRNRIRLTAFIISFEFYGFFRIINYGTFLTEMWDLIVLK